MPFRQRCSLLLDRYWTAIEFVLSLNQRKETYFWRLNTDAKGEDSNAVKKSGSFAVTSRLNQLILWLAPLWSKANIVQSFNWVQAVFHDEYSDIIMKSLNLEYDSILYSIRCVSSSHQVPVVRTCIRLLIVLHCILGEISPIGRFTRRIAEIRAACTCPWATFVSLCTFCWINRLWGFRLRRDQHWQATLVRRLSWFHRLCLLTHSRIDQKLLLTIRINTMLKCC